nr:PREDICTED: recQ-mediated genome instability protein 1-like isoform X2 [Megachile rotundata]
MYDIATSKYKQLEQIRNTHISETEPSESEKFDKWQPPKKRMIQLRLTDGVQDIIGIEYNYISWFNDVLLPGYKIMIMGPVKCRKGVLLLEPGKCQGIGGEVDSLLIPNALENVLARALNLKENPDPYNDNESKPNAIRPEEQKVDDSFFEEDFEINLEEVSIIESSHEKDNEQFSTNTVKTEIKTETKRENVINYNIDTKFSDKQTREEKQILDDDDCFLEMVDETQFLESQVKQENVVSSLRALPKEENDDIIIIDEEDIIEDISMPSNSEQVEHTFKNEKQISHSNFELLTSKKDSSISTVQSAVRKTREESLVIGGKRTIPMSSPEIKVSKKGKMERSITEFIKPQILNTPKICDFIHDINQEVITKTTSKTIRGHIEVLGKLAKKDSLWNLECTVGDGTGTIEVSFSNKVLEEMLGFTVQEFSAKKKLKKNPEIEQQLRTSFRSAEHRIKTLDALLELELNLNKKPIVIKITDLTQEQKGIIDKKLNNFLLNK